MNATFVKQGNTINHTPGSAVSAGDIVVVNGNFVGIANSPISSGVQGSLAITGTFDIAKDGTSGPTFAVGDPVFWDVSDALAVTEPTSDSVFMGFAEKAAGTNEATVRTRLAPECKEETFTYQVEDLAAGADISARPIFSLPKGGIITSVFIMGAASGAGIDNSNTSVWTILAGSDTIVTYTFNATNTFPAASTPTSLGALNATHRVLTAEEVVKLTLTNGSTADTPLTQVRIRYIAYR